MKLIILILLMLIYQLYNSLQQTDNQQMKELRKHEEQLWDEMSEVKDDEKQREKLNTELQEVQGKLNTIYGQMKDKKTE